VADMKKIVEVFNKLIRRFVLSNRSITSETHIFLAGTSTSKSFSRKTRLLASSSISTNTTCKSLASLPLVLPRQIRWLSRARPVLCRTN
jgi:hypothetical protein